jgi:hypothetical protein
MTPGPCEPDGTGYHRTANPELMLRRYRGMPAGATASCSPGPSTGAKMTTLPQLTLHD